MTKGECDEKIDIINEVVEQLKEIKKALNAEEIENSLESEIDNLKDKKEYYIYKRDWVLRRGVKL